MKKSRFTQEQIIGILKEPLRGSRRLACAASTGSAMRLCGERLNEHLFSSYTQAQHIVKTWRNDYNHNRPHTSLKGLTPVEFANRSNPDQNLNGTNL